MKKFYFNTFIFVFIFLFIYSPRIISRYDPITILTILSLVNLFIFYNKDVINILKNKKIYCFIIGMLFSIFYLFMIMMKSDYNFKLVYRILVIIVQIFPCVLYICLFMKKHNYQFKDVCDLLIRVSFFQSFIAILMFINPNFRDFILNKLILNGLFDFMIDRNIFTTLSNHRIYGLATGYTFSMPVLQGFVAGMAIIMGLKYSVRYYMYIPFLVFSAAINARTGLLVFIVTGAIGLILFRERDSKKVGKVIIMIFIMGIGLTLFIKVTKDISPETYKWIDDAKNETINFLVGEENTGYNTYDTIISMIFLPKGKDFVFGTGKDVFLANSTGITSDIGYINDMFIGGLILIFILYPNIIIFGINKAQNDRLKNILSTVMIFTLLLVNIKGTIISKNEFLNIYILLSMAMIIFPEENLQIQ